MRSMARGGLVLALMAQWLLGTAAAFGADTGTVDAKVTVAAPCITVSTLTLDFGALPLSGLGNKAVGYTNCGSVDEKIFGKGSDASGGSASWTLSSAFVGGASCGSGSPTNQYSLTSYIGNTGSPYTVLNKTDQLLETVTAGATGTRDRVAISMPCSGSSGAGETMTFTLTFTATY
jgi:hypothetical protein